MSSVLVTVVNVQEEYPPFQTTLIRENIEKSR